MSPLSVEVNPAFVGALEGFRERFPQHASAIEKEVEFAASNFADLPRTGVPGGGAEVGIIRIEFDDETPPVRIYFDFDGHTLEFLDIRYGKQNRVM